MSGPFPRERRTPAALGIDIGSSNVKVALVAMDADGSVRELMVRSLPTPSDAAELLSAVGSLIRNILALTRIRPEAVGISSMAETGVPLDSDDRALTPLIRWNSARDRLDAESIAERYGASALFAATGVPVGPKAPLMMWSRLRRTDPDLWSRMARWSGAADLVALDLTGALTTDHTLAGRTMAYRLPAAGDPLPTEFDQELLAIAGLRGEQLPRIVLPGEQAGVVTAAAATRTGLTPGIPVILAGHDHAVGGWAAGARRPSGVADSIGTSEALLHILAGGADRAAVASAGMSLTRTVTGSLECLVAGSANGGALIAWWFERLAVADPAAVLEQAGDRRPSRLLILPYLSGRQTPAPDPDAGLRIFDDAGNRVEPGSLDPVESTRGLLEGLSLHLRWMDSEQRRLAGESARGGPVVVLGGHSIPGWLRVKAAVMPSGLRAVTAAEPVAVGAALLAAVRLGMIPEGATLPSGAVSAEPDHGKSYDDSYTRFVAAAVATPADARTSAPNHAPNHARNPRGDT